MIGCQPYPDDREVKSIGLGACRDCGEFGCWRQYLLWEKRRGIMLNVDLHHLVEEAWTVLEFSENSLFGAVERDGVKLRFHSTSFQSDTCFRFPRLGERVHVAISTSGTLLSVHGR